MFVPQLQTEYLKSNDLFLMFLNNTILGSFMACCFCLLHCRLAATFAAILSPPPASSTSLAYDQKIDFKKMTENKPQTQEIYRGRCSEIVSIAKLTFVLP